MQIASNTAAANRILSHLSETTPRGDFGSHVSDLTGCLRRRYRDRFDPAPGPSPFTLTFLRGAALHQLLSGNSAETSITVDGIIGTIDHVDDKDGLWEWKTTMMWNGKLDSPADWPESWLWQTAAYCYLASTTVINVGVLHLQGDGFRKGPGTSRMPILRVYCVIFTPEEIAANWAMLQSRRDVLLKSVADTAEPPVSYRLGSWECENCQHLAYCLPDLRLLGDKINMPTESAT